MKISIITISFNANDTIEKTLKSVVGQSYKNIEHLIIDGGSKDNTIEICNSFSHISKIISESDKGVYDAFNKGLKLATGEIIGFLNADDVFYSEKAVEDLVKTPPIGQLWSSSIKRRSSLSWKGCLIPENIVDNFIPFKLL